LATGGPVLQPWCWSENDTTPSPRVTQGELLRQEQRAGVVSQPAGAHGGHVGARGWPKEEHAPHARSPKKIGPKDVGEGPRGGGDVKKALNLTLNLLSFIGL